MAAKLQLRRGNAAQWTAANPLLAEGEMAVELDTGKFKVGNGIQLWNQLDYSTNFGEEDVKNALVNLLTNSTGTISWFYNTVTNLISSSATLSSISDVSINQTPADGSLLIFNENINKWIATTTVDKQNLDGGSY
jgi:hypothetical protein